MYSLQPFPAALMFKVALQRGSQGHPQNWLPILESFVLVRRSIFA